MEDRQRVDQHVAFAPVPEVLQNLRVRQQIAVAEHRALAAAGGAGGVEDRGQIAGRLRRDLVRVGKMRGAVEQRAGAVVVQREDVRHALLEGELADPREVPAGADHHRRLGVAQKIVQLGRLVGGVQRQVDEAGAQGRQVQHQRLDRLLGVRGHPAAGRDLQRLQQVGQHRGGAVEVAPGVVQPAVGLDRDRVEVGGKGGAQGGEEVGIGGGAHGRRAWIPACAGRTEGMGARRRR